MGTAVLRVEQNVNRALTSTNRVPRDIVSLTWSSAKGEVATGLFYLSPDSEGLQLLNTVETPFNKLSEKDLCPGKGVLEKINTVLR